MQMQKIKSLLLICLSVSLGLAASLALNVSSMPANRGAAPAVVPTANLRLLDSAPAIKLGGASPFGNLSVASSPLPTAPKVPGLPKQPGILGATNTGTHKLLGILYPDFVIVSRGTKTLTLPCHADSEFGYIGGIYGKGVYIDGTLVPLAENTQNSRKQVR